MTTRFLSNTPYARSEIEMQQIPGFRPRTSGISVSRFSYCARRHTQANNQREATAKELDTPSNCACHNCVLKAEKKNGSSPGCVCLGERLVAGCVPFCKLLEIMTAEIDITPFSARVSRLSATKTTFFHCNQHRTRFWKLYDKHNAAADEAAMCAALYLLCADTFLWKKSILAIKPDFIDFSAIQIHGVDLNGYVLFHAAKDLYKGTKHISLSELTDPELVSDEAFRLVVAAFLIRRYGAEVLCAERISQ